MTKEEITESKMQVKFRVMAKSGDGKEIMLSSWSDYTSAAQACWNYPADECFLELRIEKVWIAKA